MMECLSPHYHHNRATRSRIQTITQSCRRTQNTPSRSQKTYETHTSNSHRVPHILCFVLFFFCNFFNSTITKPKLTCPHEPKHPHPKHPKLTNNTPAPLKLLFKGPTSHKVGSTRTLSLGKTGSG